jgi:hypothetical protein
MRIDLPTLTFLPVEKLVIHERHDDERTLPLILRIRSSGVFRNPPIVSPIQDGMGRYMVLDGANRTTAIQEMGFPHVLVQVVQPGDPGLNLQNWNHVVWEMSERRFVDGIDRIPGLELALTENGGDVDVEEGCGLVQVRTCKQGNYQVCTEITDLEQRVGLLNEIVDSYKDRCRLDRTGLRDISVLSEIYPNLSGLVIFPKFELADVMRLCSQGYLLPSGITRFTISPRALHVNYPLEELASDLPLEEKNEKLHKWLQERLERKGVRYYAEATFLFDE